MERPPKLTAHLTKFYSDLPIGTKGEVLKSWEVGGVRWYKLYFGRNQGGQKLIKSVPRDCLCLHTTDTINDLLHTFNESELEDIANCLTDVIEQPLSSFEA